MREGIAGKIAQGFIDSKITPLLMITAVIVGIYATMLTPREEEPQIILPVADIMIPYAGASAEETEKRVTVPMERILKEVKGVEYIYSSSQADFSLLTVRFFVGEDMEESMVRLWTAMLRHMDKMPDGVQFPLLRTIGIDDVPVMTLTLWSPNYDSYQLRRMATELADEMKKVDNVGEVSILGGSKRHVIVQLDPVKLKAYNIDPLRAHQMLRSANAQMTAGTYRDNNQEYIVRTEGFLRNAKDVENVVVGVFNGKSVRLSDVATIEDGNDQQENYTFFGVGVGGIQRFDSLAKAKNLDLSQEFSSVTIGVSKGAGADAMRVSEEVMKKVALVQSKVLPSDVQITETRNYGRTASEKVTTLIEHLFGAIISVTIVVGLFLGWRGGLVVFLSVPITFALTLLVYYLFGYTLNRVTLFALIFVTGIVVDDSIIIVENVHRHLAMRRKQSALTAALVAIAEVGNPTILATFTVIASVLPMVFVSGLMGPYMSPMPIGASLAMLFSLFVALIGTPWLAYRLLGSHSEGAHSEDETSIQQTRMYKLYHSTLTPFFNSPGKSILMLSAVFVVLLGAVSMFYFKGVEVKMLPFDNKNEFQVVIDMPEGTPLEQTAAVTKEIAQYLKTVPEVTDYQYYVGLNAPINFNGLVRHYYLRRASNVADIQVNIVDKSKRSEQSHDIAKKVRPSIQAIAAKYGANAKVVEVPPGPPVLSTLVAEVYGPDYDEQIRIADSIRNVFLQTTGVVDVDWLVEDDQKVMTFVIDKEKAALRGISPEQAAASLRLAMSGMPAGLLHAENDVENPSILVKVAERDRSNLQDIGMLHVQSPLNGAMVPLTDITTIEEKVEYKTIHRKNMKRVVYVTGDVAVEAESPVYALLEMDDKIKKLQLPNNYSIDPLYAGGPFAEEQPSLKWDGEWHITFEVFRDLGAAFAVVLVVIYLLIVGWFQSFKTPVVMMIAIPLSLVGIIPGHWLHNAFFTATSMIGMIALAGIMVRNSVLIIDFIELRLQDGIELREAVLESAAVRTQPILLTAGTVVIGAVVILFDPIFQGLAISLMWGSIASTVLTLGVVPLVYYLLEYKKHAKQQSSVLS